MAKSKGDQAGRAPAAVGPYSLVRQAGDFYFLAGQIGLSPETGELAGPGVEEQASQALRNMDRILSGAGLDRGHVVKTTVFLADMADFGRVNEIYAAFFAGSLALPARSCVAVKGLPKGALFEIEAIAHKAPELG